MLFNGKEYVGAEISSLVGKNKRFFHCIYKLNGDLYKHLEGLHKAPTNAYNLYAEQYMDIENKLIYGIRYIIDSGIRHSILYNYLKDHDLTSNYGNIYGVINNLGNLRTSLPNYNVYLRNIKTRDILIERYGDEFPELYEMFRE